MNWMRNAARLRSPRQRKNKRRTVLWQKLGWRTCATYTARELLLKKSRSRTSASRSPRASWSASSDIPAPASRKYTRRDVKWEVGIVFQYPEYQLFEETVYRDIAFGPRNMKLPDDEIDQRVREAARFAQVGEELFERSPLELSGGQKRRIAIAGVIALRPGVLILDEPTAGLDPAGCRQILDNICAYHRESGSTVIIVSHNMDDTARIAERIIAFDHGRVAMDGTPEQVFSEPEKLMAMGLDVPQATALAMALKDAGVPLEGSIYTHGQLLGAVLRAKEAAIC